MIRGLYTGALRRSGKQYVLDPAIPTSALIGDLLRRSLMLLRGALWFQKKVFVGCGVKVKGRRNLTLAPMVTIQDHALIDAVAKDGVRIGARSKIGAYTQITSTNHFATLGKGVSIGRDCGIGQFGFIGAAGGVTIGDNVIMGQYVSFHAQQHVHADISVTIREQGVTAVGIVLEDDIWVGAKATFLDGAHVGAHSIVAAGAVVNGQFPPYSIIGGVPARLIRSRLVESSAD